MAIITPLKKIFNWQTASEKIPYKVYTALLNQTGTDAPVATVLENTIGIVTWYRLNIGIYQAVSHGFAKDKMWFSITQTIYGVTSTTIIEDTDTITGAPIAYINTYDLPTTYDNYSDDVLNKTCIEIRVYN